jgi:hypothetical protein
MAFCSQHPIALAAGISRREWGPFPALGADSPQSRQFAGAVNPPSRCGHSDMAALLSARICEGHRGPSMHG